MINLRLKSTDKYTLIAFELEGGILTPAHLRTLTPPDPVAEGFAHKGVILSGRGPVWLYGFLVHYYHPTKWVATYDPRLQGAVVVESHTPEVQVGDIIPIENPTDEAS